MNITPIILHILTVEEIKEKLLTLEYVRNELNDYKASMR